MSGAEAADERLLDRGRRLVDALNADYAARFPGRDVPTLELVAPGTPVGEGGWETWRIAVRPSPGAPLRDAMPLGASARRLCERLDHWLDRNDAARPTAPAAAGEEPTVEFDKLPPIPPTGSPYAAEWWIAWSHLRSKKTEASLSVVTWLSIFGVVVGVAALNIVIAVMAGFEIDLRDKILGANAHVVVLHQNNEGIEDPEAVLAKVMAVDGVAAASPFMYGEMMIKTPLAATGIILKGVDPERTGDVTHVRDDLRYGPQGELRTPEEKDALFRAIGGAFPRPGAANDEEREELPGIFLGTELADQLFARPGDKVQIIDPLGGGVGPLGVPTPRVREFRVAGIFESGMYEYDTKWTYVSNRQAQQMLKMGDRATGLEIRAVDIDDVEDLSAAIERAIGYPYEARHWKSLNRALFEALKLEKIVMGLILFIIVFVASLLIVSTLIMIVITKAKDIAILKAMGATDGTVMRVFMIEGSVIGLIGTIAGTLLGLGGCALLDWYEFPLETDVYFLSSLPVVVEPVNVTIVAVAAFVVCFGATLYPALRAAALDPVEGLRYE